MSYSQAFSDGEIVTIAAVAATALGGVVIGLGRGQARQTGDRRRLPDTHRLTQDARRQIERHAPAGGEIAEKVKQGALAAVESALERVPSERPSADLRAYRPEIKVDGGSAGDVAGSIRELAARFASQLGVPEAIDSASRKTRRKASGVRQRADAAPSLKDAFQPSNWLAQVRSIAPALRESTESKGDSSELRDRIQHEMSSVGERLSEAPEAIQSAGERTRDELQTRVTQPVARAASTTKGVTKESLAAAAWLTAGAAVVYFGLLSSERREQVKSALCGAIEQGRLLALDLQGYEPEM